MKTHEGLLWRQLSVLSRTALGAAVVTVGLVLAAPDSVAQSTWRSRLYPSNWRPPGVGDEFENDRIIQDFSYAGYHNGEDPIPNRGGRQFNVVDFGADSSGSDNSTGAIQRAINAAQNNSGGGIVFFPRGLYRVAVPSGSGEALRISDNSVVLRGAGSGNTRIFNTTSNMRSKAVIRFRQPGALAPGRTANLTRNRLGPTRRLHIENAGRFSVGDSINVMWDPTGAWIREHGQQAYWGNASNRTNPGSGIMQRRITRVVGGSNFIDIDVPIRYFLKTRDRARVQRITGRIRECGIENLSIGDRETGTAGFRVFDFREPGTGAYRNHNAVLIEFQRARDCWIRNVNSYRPGSNNRGRSHMRSNGICLRRAFNISVVNCRMERPQYGGAGRNGYMFTTTQSNDCLYQNCTANFSRHGFSLVGMGTSGNVFYRCRDINSARATALSGSMVVDGEGSDTHQFLSPSNLFDSCTVNNSRLEFFHRGNISNRAALTSAHCTVWNLNAVGGRFGDGVVTNQGQYGYVIGTRGRNSSVRRRQNASTRLFPIDFTEGLGDGATLRPRSLFQDQRRRRGVD